MPSSFDRFPTQITHHPTQRLDPSLSELPKLTPEQFVNNFARAMKVLTDVDITSSTAFFQWLKDSTGLDFVILGQLIDTITAVLGIDPNHPPLTPEQQWEQIKHDWIDPISDWLNANSPLNAANLFGLLDPSSLPAIEIGRLFKGEYGLITDGGFTLPPPELVDTGEWFWDNTIGVTANGCAGIIGNGVVHDLIGQPIGVRSGQPFTFDTFVRWKDASITAGSKPLQLVVLEFADRVQVGETVIASVATTGTLLAFQRLDGGDYTVPDGVDSIAPAVRVTADLLAGNVWVDDAQNDTFGHILLSWIIGPDGGTMATLFELFQSMGQLLNNTGTTQADWETWWHDLFVALGLGDANSLTASNWLAGVWFSIIHPIKVVLGLFVDMGDLLNDPATTQTDWQDWFTQVFSTVGMPPEDATKAATWIAGAWFSIVHPIRQILDQFSELQVLLNNPDAVQADWEDWLLDLFNLIIPEGAENARIAHWLTQAWFEWVAPTKAAVDALQIEQQAKAEAWQSFFQAGWDALSSTSMTFPQKIAALQSAWDGLAAELGGIEANQTLTIQKILNQVFPGLFPDGENPTGLTGVQDFFDDVRRSINQMIQSWHQGYLDVNWAWKQSLTTPSSELPGGGDPLMVPGSNDGSGDAISSQYDSSIPPPPTGLLAVPIPFTVADFPAGKITYAIAAVKDGIEGPATKVSVRIDTLFPPNCTGQVNLAWDPMPGYTFKIYREVDDTYQATDWRLIASPANAGTLLVPVQDKTIRTSGVTAHPKTDAELAAQIVTTVESTAATAQSTASSAASTASAAQSTANAASTTAGNAQTVASAAQSAANTANSNANTAIANNQALANVVTRGAQGSLDGDANNVMVEAAVADLRGSLSDLQSQMDQLQAGQGGPAGGVKFTGSSMGWQPGGSTNWLMIGNGSPVQRASQAYGWTKTGAGKYIHGIWKPNKLTSPQQSATMVFQTAPAYPNGYDPMTYGGSNRIIIRAKADGSQFPFVQIWQNKARFGYWSGGVATLVGSAFSVDGTASGGFVFRQKDGNNPYKFELVQGTRVVATYTYTAAQAPYGPDYMSVGMGMVSGSGLLGDEFAPGDINQFSAKDAGAGVGLIADGVGGTMRRLSTAGYTIGPNQVITVAAPFYDEVDWISAGIHPLLTGSNAGFTVDDGGLFVCFAGFYKPSYNTSVGSATFYSGVPGAADLYAWQDAGTTGSYMNGVGIVHVNPGEAIMPAPINYSASNIQVVGEVTGKATFFSIAKVG